MNKSIYMLAATILITGLAQTAVAAGDPVYTEMNCETGTCLQGAELKRSRGEPVDHDVYAVAKAILIAMKEEGLEPETIAPTKKEKKEEAKLIAKADFEDTFYDLSCKEESDSFDQAKCLASNLEAIQKAKENLPKGADKAKYHAKLSALYKKAKRAVTTELAQTFDVENPEDIEEAREKFDELADAIDDSSWKFANSEGRNGTQLERMRAELEFHMSRRVHLANNIETYNNRYLPELEQASINYANALESGDVNAQDIAKRNYNAIKADANRYSKENILVLNPSGHMRVLNSLSDSKNTYFEKYYNEAYRDLRISVQQVSLNNVARNSNNIDIGLNDYSNRQIRSAGYSSIVKMPEYGSVFDNMMISPNDPSESLYDDDNYASRFLDNNGSSLRDRNS